MKTTKDQIIEVSLRLFAERGFDAVSTSMIAGELGITKGALYRHFTNKQDIFDSIIARMFELDHQRADEDHVPAEEHSENPEGYEETSLEDLCTFVNNQFVFWTEDTFARNFRRMLTLEQYKSPAMSKLYSDVLGSGPVRYSVDLFEAMIRSGKLNEAACRFGASNLAVQIYAPLQLMIQMADGGEDPEVLKAQLLQITEEFKARWTA